MPSFILIYNPNQSTDFKYTNYVEANFDPPVNIASLASYFCVSKLTLAKKLGQNIPI